MKKIVLAALLLSVSTVFFAQDQKLLSGLWMGTMSNDSNTIRKDQSFEIALAEYRGKVYGYSRSTFMVNDTLYYIVKRVTGTIEGDICEVKDQKIISHNFPGKADKRIKVTSTFRRNLADSTWYLEGDWKTSKTKKYYSVSGKVALKEEKDYTLSKLFPHLEELQLDKEMPFYVEAKEKAVPVMAKTIIKPQAQSGIDNSVAINKPATGIKTNTVAVDRDILYAEEKKQTDIKAEQQTTVAASSVNKPATGIKTNTVAVDRDILYAEEKKQTDIKKEQQNTVAKTTAKPVTAVKTNTVAVDREILYAEEKKQTAIKTEQQNTVAANNKVTQPSFQPNTAPLQTTPVVSPVNRPVQNPGDAAAYAEQRALATSQVVNFVSDSLELILYDNGEVDGDTVSVLMNGEVIIAKQLLKTSAQRKMIYTTGTDEITLILYAENLGKYPPNTGLLVIYDGEERYQVRFSADLKQNAAIVLRRKK